MQPFSLLIKPASADCNLACEYCFYLDRCELYPDTKVHRMSDEVLERVVRSFMGTGQQQYVFGWQGGEPTLMGEDFFARAIELQQKYGRPGDSVSNGLQTNATLITPGMAKLFARYKFLLGVSMDGPPGIHDLSRRTKSGDGTHARVMDSIELLKKEQVEFNILVLVSAANAHRGREVYEYLVDNEFYFHQYIPCVEWNAAGKPQPFAISGEDWGRFLCDIYDCWFPGDVRDVSVRLFDSVMRALLDNARDICHMGRDCRRYFVVEHNGDVYPCDFFVYKDMKLGNIMENSWPELWNSDAFKEFGALKSQWAAKCNGCEFVTLCAGDCMKHRAAGPPSDPRQLSALCEGWKMFFNEAMEGFRELEQQLRAERREAARQQAQTGAAPGRNEPCPCGSGKKFKKCCM